MSRLPTSRTLSRSFEGSEVRVVDMTRRRSHAVARAQSFEPAICLRRTKEMKYSIAVSTFSPATTRQKDARPGVASEAERAMLSWACRRLRRVVRSDWGLLRSSERAMWWLRYQLGCSNGSLVDRLMVAAPSSGLLLPEQKKRWWLQIASRSKRGEKGELKPSHVIPRPRRVVHPASLPLPQQHHSHPFCSRSLPSSTSFLPLQLLHCRRASYANLCLFAGRRSEYPDYVRDLAHPTITSDGFISGHSLAPTSEKRSQYAPLVLTTLLRATFCCWQSSHKLLRKQSP